MDAHLRSLLQMHQDEITLIQQELPVSAMNLCRNYEGMARIYAHAGELTLARQAFLDAAAQGLGVVG